MRKGHDIKIWPSFFAAVKKGDKTFEVRLNDRHYEVGDALLLREWDPEALDYTGCAALRVVRYILRGSPENAITPGYVVMAIGAGDEDESLSESFSNFEQLDLTL